MRARISSTAVSHSAISVVNALATGFGSAIGIDLRCEITASFSQAESTTRNSKSSKVELTTDFEDGFGLVPACVKRTLTALGYSVKASPSIHVSIKTDIPPAVGLKSSSAISLAVVKAVCELVDGTLDEKQILKESCVASRLSGASITGAYDDAAACLLGGLVLANNRKFELIRHSRLPSDLGKDIIIRIPRGETKLTGTIEPRATYSQFHAESAKAFEYARQNEIYLAMMLNSIVQCAALGYPFEIIGAAANEGASSVGISGKGPAVAAICETNRIANRIDRVWSEHENVKIIRARIVQPDAQ